MKYFTLSLHWGIQELFKAFQREVQVIWKFCDHLPLISYIAAVLFRVGKYDDKIEIRFISHSEGPQRKLENLISLEEINSFYTTTEGFSVY